MRKGRSSLPVKILPPRRTRSRSSDSSSSPLSSSPSSLDYFNTDTIFSLSPLDESFLAEDRPYSSRRKRKNKITEQEEDQEITFVIDDFPMNDPIDTSKKPKAYQQTESTFSSGVCQSFSATDSIPIPKWRIIEDYDIDMSDVIDQEVEQSDEVDLNEEPSDDVIRSRHRIAELTEKINHNYQNKRLISSFRKLRDEAIANFGIPDSDSTASTPSSSPSLSSSGSFSQSSSITPTRSLSWTSSSFGSSSDSDNCDLSPPSQASQSITVMTTRSSSRGTSTTAPQVRKTSARIAEMMERKKEQLLHDNALTPADNDDDVDNDQIIVLPDAPSVITPPSDSTAVTPAPKKSKKTKRGKTKTKNKKKQKLRSSVDAPANEDLGAGLKSRKLRKQPSLQLHSPKEADNDSNNNNSQSSSVDSIKSETCASSYASNINVYSNCSNSPATSSTSNYVPPPWKPFSGSFGNTPMSSPSLASSSSDKNSFFPWDHRLSSGPVYYNSHPPTYSHMVPVPVYAPPQYYQHQHQANHYCSTLVSSAATSAFSSGQQSSFGQFGGNYDNKNSVKLFGGDGFNAGFTNQDIVDASRLIIMEQFGSLGGNSGVSSSSLVDCSSSGISAPLVNFSMDL